ncbi:hypothetical protein DICPUDRAFT_154899 [Dictyostelium purpureum]|uniref:Uncharacterized protein n=1 Tax=Dictyostelium purpureum TaxID=5786 RepID=F0ZSJ8_DICPU|nr:uncharacterized protein DICPUDRAFT_154899 [Dictyostelium purpureum]EGC33077.1 hypothetical protein DICPUDRAFT_154899 [Dictyostelium purpureum]|eukprot:XP_003290390.1 hypothetical protein DICPUDRAFT_154899 [Dictyostelium purpureum]
MGFISKIITYLFALIFSIFSKIKRNPIINQGFHEDYDNIHYDTDENYVHYDTDEGYTEPFRLVYIITVRITIY